MPTNEQIRRGNGQRIESERRATGSNNEAERRGINKQMENERRGTSVVDDINSLVRPQARRNTLRPVEPVGSVPARQGVGSYKAPPAASTGGGIASPLVEIDTPDGALPGVAGREYFPDRATLYSSDYLIAVEILPLKTLRMTDANGAAVELQFKKPKPPETA